MSLQCKQLKFRNVINFAFLFLGITTLTAQQVKITGVVKDNLENGIPNVKVFYRGSTDTVLTNTSGEYSIEVPKEVLELKFFW